jgi:hypothetical protein
MKNSKIAKLSLAERFEKEIKKIKVCKYCGSSVFLNCVTLPSPDGMNRVIYCLNHKPKGMILSRFACEAIQTKHDFFKSLRYLNTNF